MFPEAEPRETLRFEENMAGDDQTDEQWDVFWIKRRGTWRSGTGPRGDCRSDVA